MGEYQAILFEEAEAVMAYALFREAETEVHLRQCFVVRDRRREGIGRRAMTELIAHTWPRHKRLTVSVLVRKAAGVALWRSVGYTDYDLTLEIIPTSGHRQEDAAASAHRQIGGDPTMPTNRDA